MTQNHPRHTEPSALRLWSREHPHTTVIAHPDSMWKPDIRIQETERSFIILIDHIGDTAPSVALAGESAEVIVSWPIFPFSVARHDFSDTSVDTPRECSETLTLPSPVQTSSATLSICPEQVRFEIAKQHSSKLRPIPIRFNASVTKIKPLR